MGEEKLIKSLEAKVRDARELARQAKLRVKIWSDALDLERCEPDEYWRCLEYRKEKEEA